MFTLSWVSVTRLWWWGRAKTPMPQRTVLYLITFLDKSDQNNGPKHTQSYSNKVAQRKAREENEFQVQNRCCCLTSLWKGFLDRLYWALTYLYCAKAKHINRSKWFQRFLIDLTIKIKRTNVMWQPKSDNHEHANLLDRKWPQIVFIHLSNAYEQLLWISIAVSIDKKQNKSKLLKEDCTSTCCML